MDSALAISTRPVMLRGLPSLRVARKGGVALAVKIAGAGLALVLQIALARALGLTGYGEYAYVFAWLQLALLISQGGFAKAALRYIAEYRALKQIDLARGFIRRCSQVSLLESMVLALLMVGGAIVFRGDGSIDSARNFMIAGATLPLLSQSGLCSAIVRGLGHVIPSMLTNLAQPLLQLFGVLAAAYVLQFHFSARLALSLNFFAAACSLGILYAVRCHYQRALNSEASCEFRTREWLQTATQMLLASSLVFLQARTGVILSGMMLNASEAGTYAVMERLTDVVLLGMTSVNLLAAPSFSALHAQGRRDNLQAYARLAAWGATAFMLATSLPLVFFGKPILRLFGDEFVAGYPVLMILLVGAAVNAMCGSVGILLIMTGHHRQVTVVALASLCLNLVLSVVLIPRFGIVGTSIAFAASIALTNVCLLLMVRRHLGIWSCIGHLR